MDYYKKFISEEYEWVFDFGTDTASILLDDFRDSINEEEFENNFDLFRDEATERYINDEYYTQCLHEQMDACFRDVLNDYVNDKENFINGFKRDEKEIQKEIKQEIKEAYKTLKRYENSKELLEEIIKEDKSTCPSWLKDLVK